MDEKRLVVTAFGLVVAGILGFLAYHFIAALTVAVFLYYSTRRFYNFLERLHLPDKIRAVIVLATLAIPLLVLLGYTVVLMILEVRNFINENPTVQKAVEEAGLFEGIEDIPELTLDGFISAYQSGDFDPIVDFLFENASFLQSTISGMTLNALIVVVVTYYLLIDGWRVQAWLLRFDEDALLRKYLEAADEELEAVLFGNLLNVIAISLIAIVTFVGYNLAVPAEAQVPYPALAGALTGVASLVPVIGMKIVYIPLTGAAAVPLLMESNFEPLVYIGGFLVLTIVVVDTIPDIVLRPYFSGENTHVGLLMLAYIFGPTVLGFYGLFFAPIVLVLTLTFGEIALPRLLGEELDDKDEIPPDQAQLDDFSGELLDDGIEAGEFTGTGQGVND